MLALRPMAVMVVLAVLFETPVVMALHIARFLASVVVMRYTLFVAAVVMVVVVVRRILLLPMLFTMIVVVLMMLVRRGRHVHVLLQLILPVIPIVHLFFSKVFYIVFNRTWCSISCTMGGM